MSRLMVVLVGGEMDGQIYMTPYTEEPRLKFKFRDIDEASYVMGVYERAGIGPDGIQEYTYLREQTFHHESLSGADEDLWILKQFPLGFQGFAAEVGAYDGVSTSNTLLLEQKGWSVLCIEPNPWLEGQLRQNRKLVEICACASQEQESVDFHVYCEAPGAFSALEPIKDHPIWHPKPDGAWDTIQVPVHRLDYLLEQHQFPRLDVLSVDVEGGEIDVLNGISLLLWGVKAIVAESWDHPGKLVPYLADRGFRLAERIEPNDLFLRA